VIRDHLNYTAFYTSLTDVIQRAARERLESQLADLACETSPTSLEAMNPAPLGTENGPHQHIYKISLDPQEDTVIANEKGSRAGSQDGTVTPVPVRAIPDETKTVFRLRADELVRLAPRLKSYLRHMDMSWPDLVDAAGFLRADLDISKSLWGDACMVMGREQAAIAVAIISAKDPEHFRTTPGGYFYGMVTRAKAGTLNLDRTLWGMRRAKAPSQLSTARGALHIEDATALAGKPGLAPS